MSLALAARALPGQGEAVESVLLHRSADAVWRLLADGDGFARAFGLASARVELSAGGTIRTHHSRAGTLDDEAAVAVQVAAALPARLLVLQLPALRPAEGSPPPKTPPPTCSLHFEALGPDRCRLGVVRSAWSLGDADPERLLLHGGRGGRLVDVAKRLRPTSDPSDPAVASAAIRDLVGGTWTAFDGRLVGRLYGLERVAGGFEFELFRSTDRSAPIYLRCYVAPDRASDALSVLAWNGDGQLLRGHVRVPAPGHVEFAGVDGDGRPAVRSWRRRGDALVEGEAPGLVYTRKDQVPPKLLRD